MSQTRREFVTNASIAGIAAAGLLAAPGAALSAFARSGRGERTEAMDVLFLGGTGMLGPQVVERLVKAGHRVTLFNRGNRDEMFPDLELIRGNRIVDVEPGLEPLREAVKAGRRWDVVIDTASVHTWVKHSAELLRDAADRYVFVSSMSVYADNGTPGADEGAALAKMPDDVADGITRLPYDMRYFGSVKARSEAAAERYFSGAAFVVRPGLIVGPRDFTHRFTYWPWRVREGGEVLAPGEPGHVVSFIDVRDLAAFIVRGIETKAHGAFNVSGPARGEMTMGGLLDACKKATGSDATLAWAPARWLAERGVHPWQHMPVWIPPAAGMAGFHTRSVAKAMKAGLTTRPVEETISATLTWFDEEYLPKLEGARAAEDGPEVEPGEGEGRRSAPAFEFGGRRPGLTRERERELLRALEEQEGR